MAAISILQHQEAAPFPRAADSTSAELEATTPEEEEDYLAPLYPRSLEVAAAKAERAAQFCR